jgi:ketosteroid isomerase-like protein
MYRLIVAAKIRATWREMARHNYDAVVRQFAPTFEYRFVGDHALGGVRRTRESQAAWFERVFRVFPTIEFTVTDVVVSGWPWRTRAVALLDVRIPGVGGYAPGEEVWTNEIMQLIHLRWGRITAITTMVDTQREVELLRRLAAQGMEEAAAAPIVDAAPA